MTDFPFLRDQLRRDVGQQSPDARQQEYATMAYELVAQALGWKSHLPSVVDREQEVTEMYANLDRHAWGQLLLHDLALRLVSVAHGDHEEGARRLVWTLFQLIARAKLAARG